MKFGLLGPKGTHTEEAGQEYCQRNESNYQIKLLKTIEDCFIALENMEVDKTIVPLLNSTRSASWVNETLQGLRDRKVKIYSEYVSIIKHHLAVLPGVNLRDVKKIYSKDKAYQQCVKNISSICKDFHFVNFNSTADAAKKLLISKEKESAVITTKRAAKMYNLDILAENVHDDPLNKTKFIVLGRYYYHKTGNDKTTLLFEFKDVEEPGLLGDVLHHFSENKISLAYIQSIPKGKLDDFTFYCEIFGHLEDKNVNLAIEKIKNNQNIDYFKVLGSYPRSK